MLGEQKETLRNTEGGKVVSNGRLNMDRSMAVSRDRRPERLRAMQSWGEGLLRVADRYVTLGYLKTI